ncbi:MAG: bifunctional folylpolyglutamate synthase/dihydrofolate synthase [Kiritimatiellae bacterium]|jgi:dihydrofolate synthase/folylpolyglutamate synthase|nr:bifunctional folylpolyglutamate synthase/dihydrofolate synthase [Kiritimatiellia bacterium]
MKPGLEKIRLLLDRLDNPQHTFAAVHIAGTNGKGSVAAICDSVLCAAGYPVGRYTSPHLNSINERFLINGAAVQDQTLIAAAETVMKEIEILEKNKDIQITFFEAMTAIAFLLFRDAGMKLVVLETGLGGCLDATNVVEPLISVITRVGIDHSEWLGDTIEKIASEKGGIIKPGRPVVVAENSVEVMAVLGNYAQRCNAPLISAVERVSLTRVSGDLSSQIIKVATDSRELPKIETPMSARFDLENSMAAICALEVLHDLGVVISDEAFVKGFSQVQWKGRFQKVCNKPVVILDGAHNPDAASALRLSLKQCGIKDHVYLVAGFCGEKNAIDFLKKMQALIKSGYAVAIDNPRSLKAGEVGALMRSSGIRDVAESASVKEAVENAMQCAREDGGTVLVTGSLFLVAEVLELFEGGESGQGRRLNEGCGKKL